MIFPYFRSSNFKIFSNYGGYIDDIDEDNLEISFITQNYGSETISTLFDGTIEDLGGKKFLEKKGYKTFSLIDFPGH